LKILILGAGPTGLGAAWRLSKLGHNDWDLLEAKSYPGGLATSFVDDKGFTWDIGVHALFSHYEYFDKLMSELLDDNEWVKLQREAWIWTKNRFVPYPFQNNIRHLPTEDIGECINGLLEIKDKKFTPKNFDEWVLSQYGTGLSNVFFRPYNKKIWAHSLDEMNTSWVGERVAPIDLDKVLNNLIFGKDDLGWGPNNTFRFPLRGGTGTIWKECAKRLPDKKLHFGCNVKKIDLEKHVVITEDGREWKYDSLVSTIPLTTLAQMTGMDSLDKDLLHTSTNIVGVGIQGKCPEKLLDKCWVYFPEDNCQFYRVTIFSNFSKYNVPTGEHWSLLVEVAESDKKFVDKPNLNKDVIQGMRNVGLLQNNSSIESVWSMRVEYGYPVPGINRNTALDSAIPFLEKQDVYSRGRFWAWKYEVGNQDHSLMQGVEVIDRLLLSMPELTFPNPDLANSKKN
jgi:protoporphyrinogen oxidase